jgi:hypothetical protein
MSLSRASLMDVVKKQYAYKLKSYIQVFMSLVVLQLIAVLFSFNGVGMMGSSSASIEVDIHYFSADIVVIFTMLWAFITAILITTKAYRNDDFAFVTNRVSSNLSNMLFLITASMIGGLTAILTTHLMKIVMYFFKEQQLLDGTSAMAVPEEILSGIVTTIFYVLLFSALGYFVGTLVQLNRIFVVLLPALVFGSLFLGAVSGNAVLTDSIVKFFFTETSLSLFIVKIIVTASLLFSSAFVLSNGMEVRQ